MKNMKIKQFNESLTKKLGQSEFWLCWGMFFEPRSPKTDLLKEKKR